MDKKETILKQHDEGYKSFFKDKKTFFEFLEDFVGTEWTGNLNENDWELIDKEFIDENLKKSESDIVYKGKIQGEEVIVYVLIELQSSVDFTMPIRLLFYMCEIWKSEFYNTNKNERERKDYKLPPILPMVIFNGKDEWTVEVSFKDKVKSFDFGNESYMDFKYELFNINKIDDIILLNNESIISKIFYIDKEKDITELGHRLLSLGNEWTQKISEDQQKLFKTWLRVMLENNKQRIVDNTIRNILNEINFKEGDEMVSNFGKNLIKYFEHAKIQGLTEGREEGREEGLKQGIESGKKEICKNLIKMGMPIDEIVKISGLSQSVIKELIAE